MSKFVSNPNCNPKFMKIRIGTGFLVFCVFASALSLPAVQKSFFEYLNFAEQSHHAAYSTYSRNLLVLEWSNGICNEAGGCINYPFYPRTQFSVKLKGLWPSAEDRNTGAEVALLDCDPSNKLQRDKFSSPLPEESYYQWNDLFWANSLQQLWSKHGACWNPSLTQLEKVPSYLAGVAKDAKTAYSELNQASVQQSYFTTAMKLANHFNRGVIDALNSLSVSRDGSYSIFDVSNEIKKRFRISKMHMRCTASNRGQSILSDIRFCLDLNYNLINCRRDANDCDSVVHFPVRA